MTSHIIKTWRPNEPGYRNHNVHTAYHIKSDVIWALGPKAKHEIMRGQWCRELKDVNLLELLKLFKKTFILARNVFHSRVVNCNVNQKWRNETSERNTFQEILSPENEKLTNEYHPWHEIYWALVCADNDRMTEMRCLEPQWNANKLQNFPRNMKLEV